MLKLYKRTGDRVTHYHEAWSNGSQIIEHWGVLGERGDKREHSIMAGEPEETALQRVLASAVAQGFAPIEIGDHAILMIEFLVDGMGTTRDAKKRHALEGRLNGLLGWTGLGHCDGGSIGSGTMEVCCFVVDFEIAKRVVAADLEGSAFGDYARIFNESSAPAKDPATTRHADTSPWTLLEYQEEQRPAMIRARGEIPPGISTDDYAVLVNIYWRIAPTSTSGMPNDTEVERMSKMEDLLHDLDGPEIGFMMFAVTGNMRKEWIWYVRDQSAFLAGLNRQLAGQDPFPIEIEVSAANGWASYKDIAAHFRH